MRAPLTRLRRARRSEKMADRARRRNRKVSCRRHLRFTQTGIVVHARRAYIAAEKRMAVTRCRCELRMKLNADKPGVVFQFDNLDQVTVNRCSGYHETFLFQLFAILIVEFVAMPMPLNDSILAI